MSFNIHHSMYIYIYTHIYIYIHIHTYIIVDWCRFVDILSLSFIGKVPVNRFRLGHKIHICWAVGLSFWRSLEWAVTPQNASMDTSVEPSCCYWNFCPVMFWHWKELCCKVFIRLHVVVRCCKPLWLAKRCVKVESNSLFFTTRKNTYHNPHGNFL